MSEHQYYEFEAVDRRLTPAQQAELRAISSRAEISSTRFVNVYNYGDFRGDPAALMGSHFDLHLYLANWGTRRLMVRLPREAVEEAALAAALDGCGRSSLRRTGDRLILDLRRDPEEPDDGFDRDDENWLPALAPLREAALGGDLRLAYLAWLSAVSDGEVDEGAVEPLDGLGPLDSAMKTFAAFFSIDPDLLAAAAERAGSIAPPRDAAAEIATLSPGEKDAWLVRLHAGEPGLAAALKARLRPRPKPADAAPTAPRRSAADLLARAEILAAVRREAEARAAEQARRRAADEEERKRQLRIRALASRGEFAWREVETEVERRSAPGYDRAASLLADLRALAERDGTVPAFAARLAGIRARHAAKRRFIERLDGPAPRS